MWKPDQPNPKNIELPFDVELLNIFLSNHFKKNITIETAQRFGSGFSNLTFLLILSDGNELVMGASSTTADDVKLVCSINYLFFEFIFVIVVI